MPGSIVAEPTLTQLLQFVRRAATTSWPTFELNADDLFPVEIIRGLTRFADFDELIAAAPFPVEKEDSFEDFAAEEQAAWDAFIASESAFPSWRELLHHAVGEWVRRFIAFGRVPPPLPFTASAVPRRRPKPLSVDRESSDVAPPSPDALGSTEPRAATTEETSEADDLANEGESSPDNDAPDPGREIDQRIDLGMISTAQFEKLRAAGHITIVTGDFWHRDVPILHVGTRKLVLETFAQHQPDRGRFAFFRGYRVALNLPDIPSDETIARNYVWEKSDDALTEASLGVLEIAVAIVPMAATADLLLTEGAITGAVVGSAAAELGLTVTGAVGKGLKAAVTLAKAARASGRVIRVVERIERVRLVLTRNGELALEAVALARDALTGELTGVGALQLAFAANNVGGRPQKGGKRRGGRGVVKGQPPSSPPKKKPPPDEPTAKSNSDAPASEQQEKPDPRNPTGKVEKVNNRYPRNSKFAGQLIELPPDLAKKYPKGLQFNEKGYPDFGPYLIDKVSLGPNERSLNRPQHRKIANERSKFKREPKGYTWHHHQDKDTLELVPTDLHDFVQHTGGFAKMRMDRE